MAPTHSTGLKDYNNNLTKAGWDADGRISYYTGTKPASANSAPTGTLLCTFTLAQAAYGASSGGLITANAIADTTAVAGGTIGWGRKHLAGDAGTTNTTDRRVDFSITMPGADPLGDMILDNTAVVPGQTVTLDSLNYQHAE